MNLNISPVSSIIFLRSPLTGTIFLHAHLHTKFCHIPLSSLEGVTLVRFEHVKILKLKHLPPFGVL